MDERKFVEECERLGLSLDGAQVAAFSAFEQRLYEANETKNLTRVPRAECGSRHFLDSLLFQDLIPSGASVLDIGSGPGLPAWPLACARPDLRITALDSNGKMIQFLSENLLPNLEAVLGRAEDAEWRNHFEVVTGRALAPLGIQLELSAGPCRIGGAVIPMRTESERPEQEFGLLGLVLEQVVIRTLPDSDAVRAFPVYRKNGPTPREYPRRWAEIKKRPM